DLVRPRGREERSRAPLIVNRRLTRRVGQAGIEAKPGLVDRSCLWRAADGVAQLGQGRCVQRLLEEAVLAEDRLQRAVPGVERDWLRERFIFLKSPDERATGFLQFRRRLGGNAT